MYLLHFAHDIGGQVIIDCGPAPGHQLVPILMLVEVIVLINMLACLGMVVAIVIAVCVVRCLELAMDVVVRTIHVFDCIVYLLVLI